MMNLRWYQCALALLVALSSTMYVDAAAKRIGRLTRKKTGKKKEKHNILQQLVDQGACNLKDDKELKQYARSLYVALYNRFSMKAPVFFFTGFEEYLKIVRDDLVSFYTSGLTSKRRTLEEIKKARLDSAVQRFRCEVQFIDNGGNGSVQELKKIYKLIGYMIRNSTCFTTKLVEVLKQFPPQPIDCFSLMSDEDIES